MNDLNASWLAVTGTSSLVLGLVISPYLGLFPPLISLAIYLHRLWRANTVKALRAENEELRKQLEKLS